MNNKASITGKVIALTELTDEKTIKSGKVYELKIESVRNSGYKDIISIIAKDKYANSVDIGDIVLVQGKFIVMAAKKNDVVKTKCFIMASELNKIESDIGFNTIFLRGKIHKKPKFRTNIDGKKLICELLLCVDSGGKNEYIPCIAWNDNALYTKQLEIGEQICVDGRIQSRTYIKTTNNNSVEITVNEVSIRCIIE